MASDDEKLSREVSYALWHKPGECGLSLDSHGRAPLDDWVAPLRRRPEWGGESLQLRFNDFAKKVTLGWQGQD